jgi:predicted RNA-binding protein with PUA-like domain
VEDADNDAVDAEPAKKRGRPSKKAASENAPKKRGRPAKVVTEPAEAPAAPDTPAPRKRHSGRTGGPTTKIATDATDASEQLEEELVDEVSKSAKTSDKRKASSEAENESGKNYWLMKAEQVDRMETLKDGSEFNTKFTIDDLKERGAPEPWEGVRNVVARNNMRAMKLGDLAFFYASQGKQPGITGIMEVVKEHEPDFTATDASSIGFVEPSKRGKENQWSLVHVEFRKKLSKPVTLKELQKYTSNNGVLRDMQVMKQTRLSVAKVTEKEWNFIINNLIEGYESEDDEDAFDGVDESTPMPNLNGGDQASEGAHDVDGDDLVDVDDDANNSNLEEFGEALEGDHVEELEIELPLDNTSAALMDVDVDELPTSGTEIPPITLPTSRPTSRQEVRNGSRPVSRAGSRTANSRQGSVAPLPVLQTTEETYTSFAISKAVAEPARPSSRTGSLKPASRASSDGPSRATSLQPAARGSSREPSVRPGSRGLDKTPNAGLMPSLLEHMTNG